MQNHLHGCEDLEVKEEKDRPYSEPLTGLMLRKKDLLGLHTLGNLEGTNLETPIFVSFCRLLCFPVMVQ
jgi:hypothetical protein